jgi:hypothetical protein
MECSQAAKIQEVENQFISGYAVCAERVAGPSLVGPVAGAA